MDKYYFDACVCLIKGYSERKKARSREVSDILCRYGHDRARAEHEIALLDKMSVFRLNPLIDDVINAVLSDFNTEERGVLKEKILRNFSNGKKYPYNTLAAEMSKSAFYRRKREIALTLGEVLEFKQ